MASSKPRKATTAKKTGRTRPHRAQPAGAPEEGDALLLNENGTVRCRWRGHNVLLWTPTIGEYEEIIVQHEADQAWYQDPARTASEVYSASAPNPQLWVKIIDLLGDNDDEITATDLPPWMLSGDTITRVIRNWRVNPLARGDAEDLIQRLATETVSQLLTAGATPSPSSSPEAPSTGSEAT